MSCVRGLLCSIALSGEASLAHCKHNLIYEVNISGARLVPLLSDCITLTAKNTEVGSYLLVAVPRQDLWICITGQCGSTAGLEFVLVQVVLAQLRVFFSPLELQPKS